MTKREIFIAALEHKNTGKVPVDFGATVVSCMHINCIDKLRKHYGLEKKPVKLYEPYQMLGYIDEDLACAMDVSVRSGMPKKGTFGFENSGWRDYTLDNGLEILVPRDFNVTKDENGVTYMYPQGDMSVPPSGKMPKGGYYFDAIIRQQPYDEDNPNVEDNLEEFGYAATEDILYQKEEAKRAKAFGGGVLMSLGGCSISDIAAVPGVRLKNPKGIRDVEEWYVTLATRKSFIHELFDRQTDIALANAQAYYEQLGDLIDVVFICGTDFGTQNSTFCSADTFRKDFLPYYQKVTGWIHKNTNWKIMKHTCGAVAPLIPLLIEAGFDILNPVQCSCPGMEPETLKKDFGKDIVFWGGGVDTQMLLPFGKPSEIREQVLRRLEVFSKDGGYVFNAIHNVQGDTPIENIVAMIEAAREFNGA